MKADINVTPLIDVLLVLLIIFMLVAPVAPRALEASLPPRPEGRSDLPPTSLVLEVRADDFALNTSPVLTLEEPREAAARGFRDPRRRDAVRQGRG